jgi:hypothetical protein
MMILTIPPGKPGYKQLSPIAATFDSEAGYGNPESDWNSSAGKPVVGSSPMPSAPLGVRCSAAPCIDSASAIAGAFSCAKTSLQPAMQHPKRTGLAEEPFGKEHNDQDISRRSQSIREVAEATLRRTSSVSRPRLGEIASPRLPRCHDLTNAFPEVLLAYLSPRHFPELFTTHARGITP